MLISSHHPSTLAIEPRTQCKKCSYLSLPHVKLFPLPIFLWFNTFCYSFYYFTLLPHPLESLANIRPNFHFWFMLAHYSVWFLFCSWSIKLIYTRSFMALQFKHTRIHNYMRMLQKARQTMWQLLKMGCSPNSPPIDIYV